MVTIGSVCGMQTNKLCKTLIDPTVYYHTIRVAKLQTGYMEIGDNLGFTTACHCNHEDDEESEYESSFDSQPHQSIESDLQLAIDNNPGKSIDSSPTNEISIFSEHCYPSFAINSEHPKSIDYQIDGTIERECNYSIFCWANNSYHESFAVDIALPKMRSNEYDEYYHKEKMIEYHGPGMDDEGVLHTSHATNEATSIDSNIKASIEVHHIPDSEVQIENNTDYSYVTPDEFGIFQGSRRSSTRHGWTCSKHIQEKCCRHHCHERIQKLLPHDEKSLQ